MESNQTNSQKKVESKMKRSIDPKNFPDLYEDFNENSSIYGLTSAIFDEVYHTLNNQSKNYPDRRITNWTQPSTEFNDNPNLPLHLRLNSRLEEPSFKQIILKNPTNLWNKILDPKTDLSMTVQVVSGFREEKIIESVTIDDSDPYEFRKNFYKTVLYLADKHSLTVKELKKRNRKNDFSDFVKRLKRLPENLNKTKERRSEEKEIRKEYEAKKNDLLK